jgi:hypothetical protein
VQLTRVVILLWALNVPATAFAQEAGRVSPTPRSLPNPVLVFIGSEDYEDNGKSWTRYKYMVDNRADYPNELFAAAPDLPPCGRNAKASRTWVDLYEQGGKRLNGFCALESRDGLSRLWFALESGVIPPSWIYVEMTDRKTNSKYKSTLAETTL